MYYTISVKGELWGIKMHAKYNNRQKTLGPKAAYLLTTLYERNRAVFRIKDVQQILDANEFSARSLIRQLVDKGIATRLKPGLFLIVPFELGWETEYMGNPLVVAREIVGGRNYYLSYATAMEIHDMVTQPQLVVYVTTLRQRRPVTIMGIEFRFVQAKKKFFFGLSEHWATKQEKVTVSDLERTVIDGLRKPGYCGGLTEVAKGLWMRGEDMNVERLVSYAVRMRKAGVIGRLGYLLELYDLGSPELREILKHHLTETYLLLDPLLPAEGRFLRTWRLRLNVSADELLSAVGT